MPLRRRKEKRRNPLEIALYILTGLVGVYVLLPIIDKVWWARLLILVLVVIALLALQAKGWRDSWRARRDRRRRWGLGRDQEEP